MKKLIALITLTLAMSLFMTSCGDDEPTGPSEPKIGEMTASVDGSNWAAQNATYVNKTRTAAGTQVDITNPQNGITKSMSVVLATTDAQPELKTYTAICKYQESTGIGTSMVLKTWNDNNGTCEITSVTDTEIKGTFTFTGTKDDDGSTKKVTGSFYVPRQ